MPLLDGSKNTVGEQLDAKPHGTIIKFKPNFEIMEENR
jgi:hypothetical protein